jgi:uncharacterized protein (TIGR02145 family)
MKLPRSALPVVLLSLFAACSAVADGGASGVVRNDPVPGDAGRDAGHSAVVEGGASSGTFVDPRDGESYAVLRFGTETWLARNLSFATAGGSFCYADSPSNCASDGRLYTFSAAQEACPASWHLATDDDWKSLEIAVGMSADQLDLEGYSTLRGTHEGTTLKDEAGFGARMAGFKSGASYEARGDRTYFWTATPRGADVWRRRIAGAESTVFRFTNPPDGFAISVRCVMD